MKTFNNEARIYLADLAAYNEGFLAGEWIDLPVDDIHETIKEILAKTSEIRKTHHIKSGWDLKDFYPSEEWAIHDHEGLEFYGNVSEYEDLEKLNNAVQNMTDLDEWDIKKVEFFTNCMGYSLDDAIDKKDDCDFYDGISDYTELAELFCDEGLFGDIPKHLKNYIDYEAMGRDLRFDYTEYNGSMFRCD